MSVWFHSACFVIGLVEGDFITFKWNGCIEESYFPILRDEGHWVYIGEFE